MILDRDTTSFRDCVKTQESSTDYADHTDSFIEQLNAVPFPRKESVWSAKSVDDHFISRSFHTVSLVACSFSFHLAHSQLSSFDTTDLYWFILYFDA